MNGELKTRMVAGFCLVIGIAIGYAVNNFHRANLVEIHRTNIGGFILQNGKIFSIHEMYKEQVGQ